MGLIALTAFPWILVSILVDSFLTCFEVPQEVTFSEQMRKEWEVYMSLLE